MNERLAACHVSPEGRLIDAMRALDRGASGVALVVDSAERLFGILTDGDIRRALLGGAGLESPLEPHTQKRFTFVRENTPRAEVLDLMRALGYSQIPSLDAEGRLVGLHLLHDVLGSPERPNWAVVMAGGRGVRLQPLTQTVPKPMIRVAGRPILERLVLHLVSHGLRRVFIAVHHLAEQIESHFGDGGRFGCRIEYIREPRPLGTGGSLAWLPEPPVAPLLVVNGDLVTQADLTRLLDFHERGGQAATLGVRAYAQEIPFGSVETDADGRVLRMEEKPRLAALVNAGIYVLDPTLVARVPRREEEFALPRLLEECLERGETIQAFEIADDWIDIGRKEALQDARGDR